jgi:hypothetical protein
VHKERTLKKTKEIKYTTAKLKIPVRNRLNGLCKVVNKSQSDVINMLIDKYEKEREVK